MSPARLQGITAAFRTAISMADGRDVLIGIDAGTSVIKAVAFDIAGNQLACASVRNVYRTGGDGSATQSLAQTWADCVSALSGLSERVGNLAGRTAGLAVTAQGDGTWLVGNDNRPVGDAWLWLDARAAPTVRRLAARGEDRARFEATGTGLNTCQQGAQMAHMDRNRPELLDAADVALHCKDWLYLNLTGVRATDPSEASFTFGNFRTRRYDDDAIAALGLAHRRGLLPEIVDGTQVTHGLSSEAARATGLLAGTPVSLGYVDMVMTALGAGVRTRATNAACSTVGSTGVHMRAKPVADVHLNAEGTGYVIALPVPGIVTQVQTNMGATLNIDWILRLAADLMADAGREVAFQDLVARIEHWLETTQPGALLYHPYISEAGERGPFVNAHARAGFIGLSTRHGFADMLRAVVEGLGMATRDCYAAMGAMPDELRLTGGAARSRALRGVLSASIDAPVRISAREEAGAAGAAMMAAVALGAYPSMDACIDTWVSPLLGEAEAPDPVLARHYDRLFPAYAEARRALTPVWEILADEHGHAAPAADAVTSATDLDDMTTRDPGSRLQSTSPSRSLT
jgi:erythritol kinase